MQSLMSSTSSNSMYLLNRQMHAPTAVDHSIYCHFYSNREKNLLVAANNILKVYRIVGEVPDGDEDVEGEDDVKGKLESLQTFALFGKVAAIEAVAFSGSQRDSVLICFPDGKISVVEYDATTHDLKTLSLHFFEDEEMREGFTHTVTPPIIRVDPDGRCAAFLVYGRNIIILPFRREAVLADDQQQVGISTITAPTASAVKTPVLSSYKLNLSDELYTGERIQNIVDMAFLEGYNEPTLCILHEPIKTWSGRLAVRSDTCAMVALSLNILQRVHPIIWSVNSMPYDCFKIMPVPKPVGGILVFTVNALIYLNQSVPSYGVSLNGFAESSTAFPLVQQKGVKISMDASHSCFISSDKLLLALKGGDLFVLTLFNDGMRSVRKFHFQKAASSVLTTCVTKCDGPYVFLGSRVGNSLLLRYHEKPYDAQPVLEDGDGLSDGLDEDMEAEPEKETVENGTEEVVVANGDMGKENGLKREHSVSEEDEPLAKQIKQEPEEKDEDDNIGDWMAKDIKLLSADDIEVYGETQDEVEKLPTSFSFEVCDSVSNIAPCSKICMGEPAFLAEEFSDIRTPQVELVASSGFGKNGALSLLQRTIRPQVVTTLQLTNSIDIWTVFSPSHSLEHHSFVVISKSDSTIIFQAGSEINELDQSGFSTQTRTILAANIGPEKFVVQVTPNGARLLEGSKQIQYLPIDIFGSPIAFATTSDPYILLLTENGVAAQLVFNSETKRLMASKPKLSQSKSKILTCCVYRDVSGIFVTESPDDDVVRQTAVNIKTEPDTAMTIAAASTIDDEDELLYGDASVEDIAKLGTNATAAGDGDEAEVSFKAKIVRRSTPTYWLAVARENGVLEIYSMPDYRLAYYIKNFPMTPKVLVDSGQGTDSQTQDMPVLKEIIMTGLGIKESRPHLFARLEDELFIYEAFPYHENQVSNHLKIRFRRLHDVVILRQPKPENDENSSRKVDHVMPSSRSWLRPFADVSGYTGVFLCGGTPTWFMMTSRGELRKHPMTIDGTITSFSAFHNVNCSKGFIYFNQTNDLRIAQLPTQVTYDATWPLRKIPLKCTVHSISYHLPSKCYIAVTSKEEPFDKLVRVAGEEKDYEPLERDDRYIWPTYDKFAMELFSPVSWEAIAGTKIEFDEWEHVTVLKNVSLASEETESGLKGYIAVGTNYCYGEDVTNRGRIWILDIIDVVPEPGMPLTRNKIKMIYCKEQKGPVTALTQVKGFLLSAIGQKIYIWQLKESQLVGVAFIDTQIFINSAVSIKNLVLVSDVYKSVSLLRYQEQTRTLALVCRDTRSSEVFGSQFVVDQNQLCFLVSDSEGNLVVHSYNPEMRESFGGTRLIRRADFHLGSKTVTFFRIRCLSPPDTRRPELKQMTVYATLDGSIGYVLPVTEKIYRRLLMLQNVLNTHIQHLAGLNPKAYRMCKLPRKSLQPTTSRVMLDGDLLTKFNNLSFSEKNEVAKKIGSTPTQV